MKNESKNICVKMYRVVGDLEPIVKVDYIDKDAQEHSACLIRFWIDANSPARGTS